MRVLVLARFSELPWYGFSYGDAMERLGVCLTYIPEDAPRNIHIEQLVALCPERPSLIYFPDLHGSPMPPGLTAIAIPTVNVNEDTYAFTEYRLRWSMLFDYTILYHPGYEERFRAAGHPRALFLPLAVHAGVISGPAEDRIFELGTVGRIEGELYVTRRRVLSLLGNHFRMNDFRRHYPPKDMARVYRQSKIVINIPREDYLQEANMRTFEVMGSGALLLVKLPSELSEMGFQEGVHFIGYRHEDELVPLIRRFLDEDALRAKIAESSRELVWREHTYQNRAAKLLDQVRADAGQLFAPARRWSADRVELTYLDHYAGHMFLDRAYHELWNVARSSPVKAAIGASMIAKAHARNLHRRMVAHCASWAKLSGTEQSSN